MDESDPFATVTVAVLENRVQRPVRVRFSTEVLANDTATGQYIIVFVAWQPYKLKASPTVYIV